MDELFQINGFINRITAEDIFAGAIVVLDENNKIALASTSNTGSGCGLFIAQAKTAANAVCAAKTVGAATGTAMLTATAGEYKTGAAVFIADDGKIATSGSRQIGVVLADTITLTEDTAIEIAPVFCA